MYVNTFTCLNAQLILPPGIPACTPLYRRLPLFSPTQKHLYHTPPPMYICVTYSRPCASVLYVDSRLQYILLYHRLSPIYVCTTDSRLHTSVRLYHRLPPTYICTKDFRLHTSVPKTSAYIHLYQRLPPTYICTKDFRLDESIPETPAYIQLYHP
jgi:hypothetical protein